MIDWDICSPYCKCCQRADAAIVQVCEKWDEQTDKTQQAAELALKAVDQRDRWRAIARQLFHQAIFASPESRAKIVAACPGIEKEGK